jgi:cardiolipin synthase A/B
VPPALRFAPIHTLAGAGVGLAGAPPLQANGRWRAGWLAWLLLVGCLTGCAVARPGRALEVPRPPSPAEPAFAAFLADWTGAPGIGGNRIHEHVNGLRFYPAITEAIRRAQHEILFETYLISSGEAAAGFFDALSERAQAGLEVRLLVDWIGARGLKHADRNRLRESGVDLRFWHPGLLQCPARLNHRTHRKLLVLDRKVGFTGGAGVHDNWLGDALDEQQWRDSMFEIHGPAVLEMAEAFDRAWDHVGGSPPSLAYTLPNPNPHSTEPEPVQVLAQRAADRRDKLYEAHLLAVRAAQHRIRLGMAYFIPPRPLLHALLEARERGVDIEILLPGKHMDSWVVKPASRPTWGPLLRAGIRIFRFEPSMYHSKVLIVDDTWVSIGSINWDNRSLRLNEELNLNVWSPTFAADQLAQFEADKTRCTEVTYDEWRRRGPGDRLLEWLVWPFKPLL